jgi:hypothetical protein
MQTITVYHGDAEPDRDLVFRDREGDEWIYGVVPGAWAFSLNEPGKAPWSSGCGWEDIDSDMFPLTSVRHRTVEFVVKDSGQREEYANGFVRDTEDGKPDYATALEMLHEDPELLALITRPGFDLLPWEALRRWSDHMEKGAAKYGRNNWTQARGLVAKARFARSLVRHVAQYITGDRTEDHAAAVCFNVWAAEFTPAPAAESEGT